MIRLIAIFMLFLFTLPANVMAATKSELYFDVSSPAAGKKFHAVLELIPDSGWHSYWVNPGDSGLATEIDWTLPEGWQASPIIWAVPDVIDLEGLISYGYHARSFYIVELTPPENFSGDVTIKAEARWLLCNDICIPGSDNFEKHFTAAPLPVVDENGKAVFEEAAKLLPAESDSGEYAYGDDAVAISLPWQREAARIEIFPETDGVIKNGGKTEHYVENGRLFIKAEKGNVGAVDKWPLVLKVDGTAYRLTASHNDNIKFSGHNTQADVGIVFAIMFAFIGGVILNAMPCVFPILSLKALAVAKKSAHSTAAVRQQGLAYSAGVVMSFLLLAGGLILLQNGGKQIGWGYQMQSPLFVVIMSYLLFAMGLNLSGVFELPMLFGGAGSKATSKDGVSGSFITGVLATAVATPCTAPFMAPALGFALTQPALQALLVFVALGLGLSFPYLLICFVPVLHRHLPKPGAWMLRFRQAMAFAMYGSAAWLIWVLTQQVGASEFALVLCGFVMLGLLLWFWPLQHSWNIFWRWLLRALLAVMIFACVYGVKGGEANISDEAFSQQRLDELVAQKKPVLVDATAAWCITCKVNEKVALRNENVQAAFAKFGVTVLVADWTNQNQEITRYLASFGRNGVPLVVYYPPTQKPVVLPQILTPSIVVEALEAGR